MTALRPAGSTRAWRRIRLYVLDRDGWRCRVPVDEHGRITPAGRPCGLPAVTADHIIPRTRGGSDDPSNLRAACEPHNLNKGGRLDDEVRPAPSRRDRRPPAGGRAWTW